MESLEHIIALSLDRQPRSSRQLNWSNNESIESTLRIPQRDVSQNPHPPLISLREAHFVSHKDKTPFSEPFSSSSQTRALAELTMFQMTTHKCDCGFGSSHGAKEKDIVNHVRGMHGIDVKMGNAHFAHCN
jgi:hypothetical protein